MAKRKPARKAAKKTTKAGKAPRKAMKGRKATARPAKKPARRASRPAKAAKKAAARARTAPKSGSAVRSVAKKAVVSAGAVVAGVKAAIKKPNLDRPRKTVADLPGVPSSLGAAVGGASAARSGRAELRDKISKHTSTGPALTAGDVDADWEAAESIGDEAPGGDNPTPDQDVVDDIGRALGVEYDDDEELQGGDEIAGRDRHRWELDPDSKDDFGDEE
jgi:hypothetical protein